MTPPDSTPGGIVACSCGLAGCAELGWPHMWDPIAAGDTCVAQEPPVHHISFLNPDGGETPVNPPHRVTIPYVRYGSGYACVGCSDG